MQIQAVQPSRARATLPRKQYSAHPHKGFTRYTVKSQQPTHGLTLSGFKHVRPREAQAITFYRQRMHLSINQIASIVERSTRTVHKVISKNRYIHKLWDQRKYCDFVKNKGAYFFNEAFGLLSWLYECWVDGLIYNIKLLSGKPEEDEPP